MATKRPSFKFFDFGKPRHGIFVQPDQQDAAREKAQRQTRYNNLKRAAEKRLSKK